MKCPECDGIGAVDSGGSTPWGTWILIPCGTCDGKGYIDFWDVPFALEQCAEELELL